ncbi:hypothetical protein CHLRE_16g684155v5 [Chlamydomonas reinhardtii]|uniref:Sister chromatid cohesion protein DCC1 n=1 Tax=Chlamydomonas reinhardtii TaxID=3055 RepID=A0A2K3CW19_CHLRE|nr:uncharacterized protein CHLRE_16g684155v5 [Chlamydomonas reinhardtii]PNW72477.1 hypothetical protein CHLRE_16g684155v5 [Chlamydomonas reinhardtii]
MKLVETTNLQLLVRPTQQDEQEKPSATPPGRPRGMSQGLQTQWNSFRTAEESAPVVVSATSTSHIELVEVAPRLAPLRQLLWQHPYGLQDEQVAEEAGPAAGEDGDGQEGGGDDGPQRKRRRTGAGGGGARGYTFEELLEVVQASPEQLLAALAAEGALLLRGRWRAVDRTYLGELLEHLLLAAEQEGMPLTGLREAPLAASLRGDGYHPAVVAHCLGVYGSRVLEEQGDKEQGDKEQGDKEQGDTGRQAASTSGAGGSVAGVWALDATKVCIHFAHKVLSSGSNGGGSGGLGLALGSGRSMGLQEFLALWGRAVPEALQPQLGLDLLRAETLVEGTGSEARISSFPSAALPSDPAQRFSLLFTVRPRWAWTDLEPFLAGIKVPGQSAEAVLLRFARASQATPDSPLMYTAR